MSVYLQQTADVFSSVGSYLRLPALASTVRQTPHRLECRRGRNSWDTDVYQSQGIAAVLTALLYFKQK
jgi:hypothetical protein